MIIDPKNEKMYIDCSLYGYFLGFMRCKRIMLAGLNFNYINSGNLPHVKFDVISCYKDKIDVFFRSFGQNIEYNTNRFRVKQH